MEAQTMSAWLLSPVLVHVVVWTALGIIAVGAYLYAVSTRRRVTCRSCGEAIQMEHDTVQNCPSCGAPLP
jgi:Zn finger protein HypA/HybF involved in hydrogenase expression